MKSIFEFNIAKSTFITIYQFQNFIKFEISLITLLKKETRLIINFFIKYIQRSIELEQLKKNLIKKIEFTNDQNLFKHYHNH